MTEDLLYMLRAVGSGGGQKCEYLNKAADEIERLRAALEPFAEFGKNVDADGWTSNIHRERISTWFGPSDFRAAADALST